jgi:hypothetical protein
LTANGLSLRLSVFIVPQLDTKPAASSTIDAFPPIRDWPLQVVSFAVQFGAGPAVAATVAPLPAGAATRWAALFPSDLPVNDFAPQAPSTERLHSYPVSNVVGYLRRHYTRIGLLTPTEVPTLDALKAQGFDQIATVASEQHEHFDLRDRRLSQLQTLFEKNGGLVIPPLPEDPPLDFFRAVFFHEFKGPRNAAGEPDRSASVAVPEFDFHRGLSMLMDHSDLLRAVGLVRELTVPLDGQAATGTVRIVPTHDFASEDVAPRTTYVLDADARLFLAAPGAGSPLSAGMLNLSAPDFELVQVDPDGSALKAVEFANQVVLRSGGRLKSADSATDAALPALRSAGIALVHTGRASAALARFNDQQSVIDKLLAQQTLPDFTADDLVTGFHVDVEDRGVWRSLCRRNATYSLVRAGIEDTFESEASVGMSLVRDEGGAQPENYLHEALFHWDGWSLAAPRLGEAIQEPKDGDPAPHAEQLDNPSKTPLEIEITSTAVDGSLPRLRFGRSYRLRVRACDLVGNAVPHSSDDASAASPLSVYRRFEPIEPPALVILSSEPLSNLPGESVARLVIRSRNEDASHDADVSPELSERIVLPPRTSVTMLEQEGALDLADGTIDASAATWNLLANKDESSVKDIEAAPLTDVPYLADFFAPGVAFRGLPGTAPGSSLPLSFDATDWSNARPLRLAIVEGSGPPDWDATDRVLTVFLPKATIARVRVSCLMPASALDKMALWEWFESEAFDDDELDKLKALALGGAHWMLTPYREITLVHAVLQPLARPVVTALAAGKSAIGQPYAALTGRVAVHGASTGRVDLTAVWNEFTGVGFEKTKAGAHVCDVRVNDPSSVEADLAGQRHEFGDTKHRLVAYRAVATTRFRDYFDPGETKDPAALTRDSVAMFTTEVLSSGRPAAPRPLYAIPTFEWRTAKTGHETSGQRLTGLRVYLEAPWFSSGEGELLGVVVLPSPTDGCAGARQPANSQALDILREFPREVAPLMKSYVTQWGRDPIWLSSAPQTLPSIDNFPRATARGIGLSLSEVSPSTVLPDGSHARVAVAGHEIEWDEDRHLFFCDLDVSAGASYYPFVRLALARYQPASIENAELSPVVLADFVQLAPERVATLVRHPDNARRIGVSLSGPAYRANASFLCSSRVEVRVERFLDATESGFGWVPVSQGPTPLAALQALKDVALWSGEVELPADRADARFRIVFEEFESFLRDQVDPPPQASFGEGVAERLVYADAIEL